MGSLGQELREEREARHISIEEIATSTKIVSRYLEALEDDRLDIMPGGFFIKGIIRAYAKAIGLDPEKVLDRYKAAGLLGEAGPKRTIFQRAVPGPAPPLPPLPSLAPPPEPAFSQPPAPAPDPNAPPPEPAPAPELASGLLIEPAPKPRLSPAARKLIVGWIWRSALVLVAVAVLVLLWSSRRPRPPEPKPGSVTTKAIPAGGPLPPAAAPAVPIEPPPAVEEAWKGVTIELAFRDATWIRVYADGALQIDGLFPAGATARARADERIVITTGNAGGFTFLLNGEPARSLGRAGDLLTDVTITPANYKEFLEPRPPGPPAG